MRVYDVCYCVDFPNPLSTGLTYLQSIQSAHAKITLEQNGIGRGGLLWVGEAIRTVRITVQSAEKACMGHTFMNF